MSDAIRTAQRVAQWLEDEAVQEAIARLKKENYQLFLKAPNEEGRRMAQAQAVVLDAFETSLQAVVGVGEREHLEQNATDR